MMDQYLAAFAEIDVQEVSYIRFMLPELDFGRSDIEITSDYGVSANRPDTVVANVWARIGNSAIKGFICAVNIPVADMEQNGYGEIVMALNKSKDFRERLTAYLRFADSK
ncbi:hypothetical protein D1641_17165 [Colidextribacter sp. OB.20]|uniref:hypothetical protein n=1 Tax=Colidextribacter sp. OB.20 TaxID=2304568 RepID=UPI00136DBF9F|nr:hypothetical protein [Colidextribacter sp. OB.20]NBI11700.1 hypothetical protein [Colidextribacter sp. OB.20]